MSVWHRPSSGEELDHAEAYGGAVAPALTLLEWITHVAPKVYRDRGFLMAVCQFVNEEDFGKPRELTGHRVELDGAAYRVVTVGTFAVPDGHPALRGPFDLVLAALHP